MSTSIPMGDSGQSSTAGIGGLGTMAPGVSGVDWARSSGVAALGQYASTLPGWAQTEADGKIPSGFDPCNPVSDDVKNMAATMCAANCWINKNNKCCVEDVACHFDGVGCSCDASCTTCQEKHESGGEQIVITP